MFISAVVAKIRPEIWVVESVDVIEVEKLLLLQYTRPFVVLASPLVYRPATSIITVILVLLMVIFPEDVWTQPEA